MDYVYICRPGDNEELRYSIRSVVENAPDAKIWVVGGKPDWYIGNYIEIPQDRPKYTNAINNLIAAIESDQIDEQFVLMNDDFYILNKIESIPYMHGGPLKIKIDLYKSMVPNQSYVGLLERTLALLERKQTETVLDYELHVPMVMEKKKLAQVLRVPGLWRSIYGNVFNVGGTQMKDVKVYTEGPLMPKSYDPNNLVYDYLSSNEDSFDMLKELILEKRFSSKSIYEN